ncbi:unnamed protein product [Ilex paraguariensis]|uniref:Uncharacterized protein n=1 Tax=Ilex paraguariensis TaxID=185542 RepID=A0ABC8UHC3_9AQUA
MASTAKLSYQRLRNEGGFDDDDYDYIADRVIGRARSWARFRKVPLRRRFRVRIPSLRRFLRRKARVVVAACSKVVKRLKEGQSHFGDLFAGNYLFMQVTPTPLKCVDKSLKGHYHLPGLSSGYSLPRVSY